MSDLSTRVRLRREQLGLSQEELARRMGYRSRSSITKLEKGINDLPQSKVEELAQALETTPAALLGLDAPCACPPGFEPLPTMVQVPLIGSIACGTPKVSITTSEGTAVSESSQRRTRMPSDSAPEGGSSAGTPDVILESVTASSI